MRMSAISLQLYRVKDIPEQHSEIEYFHLTHYRYCHILLIDGESFVQTSRDAIVQRNDPVKNTLVHVNMCWGRGLPRSGKLGRSLQLIKGDDRYTLLFDKCTPLFDTYTLPSRLNNYKLFKRIKV